MSVLRITFSRTIVLQQKTQRPVHFEITAPMRDAISAWIDRVQLQSDAYLFPSRIHNSDHLSTRQYARIVDAWIAGIGLDIAPCGTRTMRRTKATSIYRRTKYQRVVQLLLGRSKLESTVLYLGIAVKVALDIAEQLKSDPMISEPDSDMRHGRYPAKTRRLATATTRSKAAHSKTSSCTRDSLRARVHVFAFERERRGRRGGSDLVHSAVQDEDISEEQQDGQRPYRQLHRHLYGVADRDR